jgi:hypothetical protein
MIESLMIEPAPVILCRLVRALKPKFSAEAINLLKACTHKSGIVETNMADSGVMARAEGT